MGEGRRRSGILAAGNWIVDHVKLIDDYPEQDALVSILSESSSNGGGPYNLLKDLAALGAGFPLAGAGLVGDDADGRAILAECDALGIDRTQILVSRDAPTSYTDVMTVASTGRRTFFHQRGANARFDGAAIDLAGSGARIFYLGYLLLLDALDELARGTTRAARLLERARAAGMRTAVDLVSAQSGRFAEIVGPSLPHVDVLFLNEYEAGRILGRDFGACDRAALEAAAGEVRARGVRELVVIHHPDGAAASAASGEVRWQGSVRIPDQRVAGAVGAGDAFAAGMLMGLHDGEPVEECLRRAVCCAALCLTHPTTSGGMASLTEALALGDQFGFRP